MTVHAWLRVAFVFCLAAAVLSFDASAIAKRRSAPRASAGETAEEVSKPKLTVLPTPAQKPVRAPADAASETGTITLSANTAPVPTRFEIGLDAPAEYQVFSLREPNRVIVEVVGAKLELPDIPANGPTGVVRFVQTGIYAPGKQRVVIHVTAPIIVANRTIQAVEGGKGYRLVLDLVPVQTATKPEDALARPFGLGAAGLQPPMPRPAIRPHEAKHIIVIDPGHGGHDSGAEKNGTVEKDAVLAFSKVLRDKLEATGDYKVLMTRDTDIFVELRDRVKFAQTNSAELFIAVHADYAGSNTSAHGATIYSLRDGVAEALTRSAKSNAQDVVLPSTEATALAQATGDADGIGAVKTYLAQLFTPDVDRTKERSSQFSRAVVASMETTTAMRDDPEQQASFVVLKTAQVPSVLIELAYVTNKEDAEFLQSDEWRGKVADSILKAVGNYFSSDIARMPL